MKLSLGHVEQFSQLSLTHVSLDGDAYWVVAHAGAIASVLRDKCAHMGSPLRKTVTGLVCPLHGWSYGPDGRNATPGNGDLDPLPFSIDAGELFVDVPDRRELLPASGKSLTGSERLDLLAHATFLLKAGDVRLLFDPWLVGDAYWGSWRHYPRAAFDDAEIGRVNHVIVSHPHPDHFDLATMELLPRDTAVYFPPFVSRIIPRELHRLGFTRLQEVGWERPLSLSDGVSFAFMRPTSLWEDSAVLVRVHDWVWLNQNDAGAPLRDDLLPQSIDLLSSAFDVGASGYPQMWGLEKGREERILRAARTQILRSIAQRAERTNARFFAPFASWWRHARPEHTELAAEMRHNTFSDLELALAGSTTGLLRTEPGTSLNLKSMGVEHAAPVARRGGAVLPSGADRPAAQNDHVPTDLSDARLAVELQRKLSDLAASPFASGVERVVFTVEVEDSAVTAEAAFGSDALEEPIRLRATISRSIAALYAFGDSTVTWNHLDIGWWVRWRREPDVYPARFMRLLQIGNLTREAEPHDRGEAGAMDLMTRSVADLVEFDPEMVSRILDRAGLPCVGCSALPSETLGEALALHGVGRQQTERLIEDLGAVLSD